MNNDNFENDGWRHRGYLPHWEGGATTQMVTFRLADSFPSSCLSRWRQELACLPSSQADTEIRRRTEEFLDKGMGEAWLGRSEIAAVIAESLLFFHGRRYEMHAWTIMPNHVHALLTLSGNEPLSTIVHTWKSFTGNRANKMLGRNGHFWQREYFDRFIRNRDHFQDAILYIDYNPVKAGLCARPQEWKFGSAGFGNVEH